MFFSRQSVRSRFGLLASALILSACATSGGNWHQRQASPAVTEQQRLNHGADKNAGLYAAAQSGFPLTHIQSTPMGDDLSVSTAKVDVAPGTSVVAIDARLSDTLKLVPVIPVQGQWRLEDTLQRATAMRASGSKVLAMINADPFNVHNGFNAGVIKVNQQTYAGATLFNPNRREGAVIVRQDGKVEIWNAQQMPQFQMRLHHAQQPLATVTKAFYFDRESGQNHALEIASDTASSVWVYSGDNFRGRVHFTDQSALLVKVDHNPVTAPANSDNTVQVRFPPFSGVVVGHPERSIVVPSGHALLTSKTLDLRQISTGEPVSIAIESQDPRWQKVRYALGAGFFDPLLVDNGVIQVSAEQKSAVSSRSALGVKADGSLLLVVADKPLRSANAGLTLYQLAELMQGLGAQSAINLDGGGSSALSYFAPDKGKMALLNTPSDGAPRPVSTHWALVGKTDPVTASLQVKPRRLNMLVGSEFTDFTLFKGTQQVSCTQTKVTLSLSSQSMGQAADKGCRFKAGRQMTEGLIIFSTAQQDISAQIHVIEQPTRLFFDIDSLVLKPGQQQVIPLTMLSEQGEVYFEPQQIKWSVSHPDAVSIDPQKGIVSVKKRIDDAVLVTAEYAGLSASMMLRTGLVPQPLTRFAQQFAQYKTSGARYKKVMLRVPSDTEASEINGAMQLSWQTNGSRPGTFGAYLVAPAGSPLSADYPLYVQANIYIPEQLLGSQVWLRGQLTDAEGKRIAIDYNQQSQKLTQSGWTRFLAPVPSGFQPPFRLTMPLRVMILKDQHRQDAALLLSDFYAVYEEPDIPPLGQHSLALENVANTPTQRMRTQPAWLPAAHRQRVTLTTANGEPLAFAPVQLEVLANQAGNQPKLVSSTKVRANQAGDVIIDSEICEQIPRCVIRIENVNLPVLEPLSIAPKPKPYLTVGQDQSEYFLNWFSMPSDRPEVMRLISPNADNRLIEANQQWLGFGQGTQRGYLQINQVRLNNLEPASEYQYQLLQADGQWRSFRFTTPGLDQAVSIHLLGDTQFLLKDNPVLGPGVVDELLSKMAASGKPDLLLHVGDFTDDISQFSLVEAFFDQISAYAANTPLAMTFGNHEAYNDGETLFAPMFGLPIQAGHKGLREHGVYSFDLGAAHIAVLNSEIADPQIWQQSLQWLRADMSSSAAPWKLVVIHRPAYQANPASGNRKVATALPQLADELNVDLVISGHDHIYSRSVPVRDGEPAEQGTYYLIAGSASAKFYDAGDSPMAGLAHVVFDRDIHTFTRLRISAQALSIDTRSVEGELIDQVTLTKP